MDLPYKILLLLMNGLIIRQNFPEVTYSDIYSYLIDTPSEFRKEKMKCYKSLEAYKFFVCGHVQDICSHQFISNKEFTAVKSKVKLFCYL